MVVMEVIITEMMLENNDHHEEDDNGEDRKRLYLYPYMGCINIPILQFVIWLLRNKVLSIR